MAKSIKFNHLILPEPVGRLGALAPNSADSTDEMRLGWRTDMAERRILRIEAALRLAGVEVENLELER